MTAPVPLTGGCQCGALRYRADALGRASICHCRMCQKATGGFFGPFVTAHGFAYTRGSPKHFRSSNKVRRGFCGACGTPVTFEPDGFAAVEVAIGTFDDPRGIAPAIQVGVEGRLPYFAGLADLPGRPPTDDLAAVKAFLTSIVSFQHPDHDTPEPADAPEASAKDEP
jgi:hypothetical protein